jgi:hypothetical protein
VFFLLAVKMLLRLTKISLRSASENDMNQSSVGDTLQPRDFSDKISYAFQLATAQGPLCNEPVQGIAVFLEEVNVHTSMEDETSARDKLGRLTGEVIKTVQSSIHQGFKDWSPRLMLAMYSCEIQASSKLLPYTHSHLHLTLPISLTNHPPNSRSTRPRLRRPPPPRWPHPLRIPQRRNPLLLHPLSPARGAILRLFRRDPETYCGPRLPTTEIRGF